MFFFFEKESWRNIIVYQRLNYHYFIINHITYKRVNLYDRKYISISKSLKMIYLPVFFFAWQYTRVPKFCVNSRIFSVGIGASGRRTICTEIWIQTAVFFGTYTLPFGQ